MQVLFNAGLGKVWKRKSDGFLSNGELIVLAKSDNISNYEIVDKPIDMEQT